ncbi:MAG TPA: GYF domain-containing protein [Candidatus Acidoferrum sp.]|nr:GYF domain-containing protein [Candidatus Acidoferrum sp.]
MNYFIKRDLQEYGPYTLSELQRYVASGNVLLTDLCHSEGSTDWLPVSQVIGNIPVPQAAPAPTQASIAAAAAARYPSPPSLHWGIVLLLGIVTCGIFLWVWAIVQANWVRKVQPNSKGMILWSLAILCSLIDGVLSALPDSNAKGLMTLFRLAGVILWISGSFSMKNSIEEHYNTDEPIGLSLNGVMVFFFNVFYFQYHFNQINETRKQQGVYA